MKEIGSEFWSVPLTGVEQPLPFPDDTVWYLSGRSALSAILDDICETRTVITAALPSWCCDSMIKPFLSHGLEVVFYPVYLDRNRNLIQEIGAVKCDVTLIMDYFGFKNCPDQNIPGIVIRDITHSVFCCKQYDADYVFGSLRKWTGVYTGGFAWSNISTLSKVSFNADELEYCNLRKKAMELKAEYINSNIGDKIFLAMFSEAEEWLDNNEMIYGASVRDVDFVKRLDATFITKKRRSNAEYLMKRLGCYSFKDSINDDECPLFVPLFLEKNQRDYLRKYLIENSIYCPIHWGVSEYHKLTAEMLRIYDTELSIICDQRYDLSDMKKIADTIEKYLG